MTDNYEEPDGDVYWLFANDDSGTKPNRYEAEEYHDFIQEMMSSDFFKEIPAATQQAMIIGRDVLCWALGHPDNPSFAKNLHMWAEAFRSYNGESPRYDN